MGAHFGAALRGNGYDQETYGPGGSVISARGLKGAGSTQVVRGLREEHPLSWTYCRSNRETRLAESSLATRQDILSLATILRKRSSWGKSGNGITNKKK